ncbi:MAG: glycosyltransferase family 2 protein [Candidatus Kapaibacterium sp.]
MISACLIVKNETENLNTCLESIKQRVGEIIVVDTGSDDNSREIAILHGAKVYEFTWSDNFSEARNYALSKANGSFILIIDADERLNRIPEEDELMQALAHENIGGFLVDVISYTSEDNTIRKFRSSQLRIFANNVNFRFQGRIHEQIAGSIVRSGFKIKRIDSEIVHSGYDTDADSMKIKHERNLRLMNLQIEEQKDDIYLLLQKAKTLSALDRIDESLEILLNLLSSGNYSVYLKDILNITAELYIKQNNYAFATKFLEISVKTFKKQILAYYKLISIMILNHNYDDAYSYLIKLYIIIVKNDYEDDFIVGKFEIMKSLYNIIDKVEDKSNILDIMENEFNNINDDNDLLLLYSYILYLGNYKFRAVKILDLLQKRGVSDFKTNQLINQIKRKNKFGLISLCMIVKNEEKFLEDCLKSVIDLVDEIIIVDTGSDDATIDIGIKFGAKIIRYKWCDDFSKARNESIKQASSEWILYLDADERLTPQNNFKLRSYLTKLSDDIGGVNCIIENINFNPNTNIGIQHGVYPRIFRNYAYPVIKFEGLVHEQISNSLSKLNKSLSMSDIKIIHLGYDESQVNLKHKIERNLQLLLKEYSTNPSNSYNSFQLAQTYIMLDKIHEAENLLVSIISDSTVSKPILATSYNIMASIYANKGDYNNSVHYAEKSLQITKNQQLAYLIAADSSIKSSSFKSALAYLEKLIEYKKGTYNVPEISFDVDFPSDRIHKIFLKLNEKVK